MPYNVKIRSVDGTDLNGAITMYDASGNETGFVQIPQGGADVPDWQVTAADHFRVSADGYSYVGTAVLYDTNVFTLIEEFSPVVVGIVAFVFGFLAGKYIKL